MLLRRALPPIPSMNRSAYQRYRLRLLSELTIWVAAAIAIIGYWEQLPLVGKGVAVVVCILVAPSIGCIKQVFASFERYSRHGLEY
jgi:hypothetical protein